MIRRRAILGFLLAAGIGIAGFIPWPVTGPLQGLLNRFVRSGWSFSVGEAQWIPWSGVELEHVRLQTPSGGKLHVVEARAVPRLLPLFGGRFQTKWVFGEIRMDPGSWNIHSEQAQQMLSSSPVTTGGSGILEITRREVRIEALSLTGPMLQMSGRIGLGARREVHLHLQGDLSRTLLEAMHLVSAESNPEPWQPFELQLDGRIDSPRIRFDSNFRSFILDTHAERTP